MKYFYVDETYDTTKPVWEACIGGLIVKPEDVVEIEYALHQVIQQAPGLEPIERQCEFKCSEFFRNQNDQSKIFILEGLCDALLKFEFAFLASHAKCSSAELEKFNAHFNNKERAIQHLAFQNVHRYLEPYTQIGCVQTIVDLGLHESFRPVYEIYALSARGLNATRDIENDETQITIRNFRQHLTPVFLDSKDSRLLQLSDTLIGLELASKNQQLTPFKQQLFQATRCLENHMTVHTVDFTVQN